MGTEQELRQCQRRRGNMMKLIREGHEDQLDRMNDSVMQGMMQDLGSNMSQRQVMTMLQDLQELGYIKFDQRFDEDKQRFVAERIMLTSLGTALAIRRRDNEDVLFS
jgi:flagellar motor switch protein FliG